MFNWFSKGLVVALLGLGGWAWYQSQIVSNLRAENHTQAQAIENQQKANQQLIASIEQERQAVENQQKLTKQLQEQMETTRDAVKRGLAAEPCAVVELPVDVRNSIKRLHERNHH